jgi:hypothetical protein
MNELMTYLSGFIHVAPAGGAHLETNGSIGMPPGISPACQLISLGQQRDAKAGQ